LPINSIVKMEKLRIVHVLHSFSIGGMEKGVATLISNRSSLFTHSIVCLRKSGASQQLLPENIKLVELHKNPGNSLLFIGKIARALKALRPHVVHTRNWGGIDGIIAAKLAGVGCIIHGEHGWAIGDPNGLKRKTILTRRILSSWVSEYICVSEQMKNWLLNDIGVKKPVSRIYNGVDSERYRPVKDLRQQRSRVDLPGNGLLVGTVGRLDPIKDHETLLKAFQRVRSTRPDAQLIVVGDGPEKERIEFLAREGVIFLGERSDVHEILQAIDVFVLPSLNEGISNTVLEAMATGLPVVATRVGGNTELVENGHTGILVDPGNSDSIADAIFRYLNDKDLRVRHGRAGRQRVLKHFNVQAMVQSYESVYRRVAMAKMA
jgi:sugar transferase (PEP-CTERM/EpsH1 system associated)